MPTLTERLAAEKGAQPGPLSRAASGFASTSPLNPMNWWEAIKHPIDTATSMVKDPIQELLAAASAGKDAVLGTDPQGRVAAAEKAVTHGVGAIPFVGKPILNADEKMLNGDVAGGIGSLAGLASGEILPELGSRVSDINPRAVAGSVGRGVETVGRGVEKAGTAAKGPLKIASAITAPSHLPMAAAEFAAPYATEMAGRGAQKLGKALQGLERDTPGPSVRDMGNVRDGQLMPARQSTEVPTEPAGGWDNYQGSSRVFEQGPSSLPHDFANEANIEHNAPFGEGALIPSPMLPSELRAKALDGLRDTGSSAADEAKGMYPYVKVPEDFGPADEGIPQQGEPTAGDVESLVGPLLKHPETADDLGGAGAKPVPSSIRVLERRDNVWGPGSTDLSGAPAQSTAGYKGANNLLYDPQTPTDYLREQLSTAPEDSPDRQFLARALTQRMRLNNVLGGLDSAAR